MTFALTTQPAELSLESKRLLWTVAIVVGASLTGPGSQRGYRRCCS